MAITPDHYNDIYSRREALDAFDSESQPADIASLRCTCFLLPSDLELYEILLRSHIPQRSSRFGALVDLGCGRCGLGRFLASRLGIPLIGVDFSQVAISQSQSDAIGADIGRVDYVVADFSTTGLRDEIASAVISLDALYMATEAAIALQEIARISVSGAPLIFTVYQKCKSATTDTSVLFETDWLALLKQHDFVTIEYEDVTHVWHTYLRQKHQRRCDHHQILRKILGESADEVIAVSEKMLGLNGASPLLESLTRYRVVALYGIEPRHR